MKRTITLGIIGWFLAALGSVKAAAQDTPPSPPPPPTESKKESQEIIIRRKGDKDTKVTVEITKDKVLINGRPLAEFKDDGVTINNRKVIVRDGNKITMDFDGKIERDIDQQLEKYFDSDAFSNGFNFSFDNAFSGKDYTYMGVNTNKTDEGAQITYITKGSPAEKAGLMINDIIYQIDDTKVSSTSDVSKTIRAKKDGDKVKVYFLRDGKKKDEKVTLVTKKTDNSFTWTKPDGSSRVMTVPRVPDVPGFYYNRSNNRLGLKIQDTDEGNGVKVLDVEESSTAATAGIMKDDLITEIGGVKVSNTDEARGELRTNKDKSTYTIRAKRKGSEMSFNIKVPKNLKTATL